MGPWMMGWDGYGYSPWWGIVMMGFWALIIVGVVLLIVWLVRQSPGSRTSRPEEDRALTILRERFARGEITREEFDAMRRTLE